MIEDMQLRGLAPLTQRAYLRAVRELARYYHKSPDLISEEELRHYFLYLLHEKHLARSGIVNLIFAANTCAGEIGGKPPVLADHPISTRLMLSTALPLPC